MTSTVEMTTEMQEMHGAVEHSPSPDAQVISPTTAVGTNLEHALTSPTPAPPHSSTPFSLGKQIPLSFSRRASRVPTIISCSSSINRSDLVDKISSGGARVDNDANINQLSTKV